VASDDRHKRRIVAWDREHDKLGYEKKRSGGLAENGVVKLSTAR